MRDTIYIGVVPISQIPTPYNISLSFKHFDNKDYINTLVRKLWNRSIKN